MGPRWLLGLAFSLGCASSPYDHDWLAKQTEKATGHAVGAPEVRDASLPPGVTSIASLREDDAVGVAVWNSMALQADMTQLGFAHADLADAGALPNPVFALLLPMGPRQIEFSATWPVMALWQRPNRVAAAKLDTERVARSLLLTGLDLVRDVRLAFADAVLAEERAKIRAQIRESVELVAKIAKSRSKAGESSDVEGTIAEADALAAVDLEKRALADAIVARERLRFVMGLGASPLGEKLGTKVEEVDLGAPAGFGKLLEVAMAARPDVRAAELSIDAAAKRLGWERSKIVSLVARLDGKPIGTLGGPPVLLLPGAQAEIPIFNWNEGGTSRAKAEMARASFRYSLTRQSVESEVRIARVVLVQAIDSYQAWRDKILPLADKSIALALLRYKEGEEAYLVVVDAVRRAGDTRTRLVELAAEVRRAHANLARAMGRKDAH